MFGKTDLTKTKVLEIITEIIKFLNNECNKLIDDIKNSPIEKNMVLLIFLEWKINDYIF